MFKKTVHSKDGAYVKAANHDAVQGSPTSQFVFQVQDSPFVDEYAEFYNHHYDFVEQIDDRSTCPSTGEASDRLWWAQIRKKAEELQVQCKKIAELFSLAKKPHLTAKSRMEIQR